MPDPDVRQSSVLFLPPQGVGQAEVGVAHHPPHPPDVPGHHGLGHQVGYGAPMRFRRREPHVDPALPDLDGKTVHSIVETARRLPRGGIEIPAMPGTTQETVLDGALAQGPALVGASVVQSRILPLMPGHADCKILTGDRLDPPLREFVRVQSFLPDHISIS